VDISSIAHSIATGINQNTCHVGITGSSGYSATTSQLAGGAESREMTGGNLVGASHINVHSILRVIWDRQ
jgi:hypothetical protein